MKRLTQALVLVAALLSIAGCKTQADDNEALRAGILQHLSAIGTLNISAMNMDIRSVSINGNQAHAEVEFRPKTGDVRGAGMQVAYNLEKRDGTWVVLNTQPLGGMIEHPDPSKNRHTSQDVHSGALPNFNEVLNPSGATSPGPLPPGHPPVRPQPPNPQSSSQAQTYADKPR